jgi:hypothetical protein
MKKHPIRRLSLSKQTLRPLADARLVAGGLVGAWSVTCGALGCTADCGSGPPPTFELSCNKSMCFCVP